jgi:CubicO group peptidase (beta-lactamase class C family)
MRKYIIITFLIFPCIICFTQQSSNDKLLAAKLDLIFSQHFKENEPGGSVFIQQANKVLYSKSFGLADLKTMQKFTIEQYPIPALSVKLLLLIAYSSFKARVNFQ